MGVVVRRVGGADYGRFLKVMIGGDSGAGKTRFSSTFPEPLYLATDPSLDSVLDRQPAYVEITSSDDMVDVLTKLRMGSISQEKLFGFAPKTVVIDTADDLQRIYIKERLAATHKDTLTIPDYGWLGDQMRDIIRNFRNLPMHVIVTTHLKDDKDEDTGRVTVQPGLVGQFSSQMSAMFGLSLLIKTAQVTKNVDGASKRVEVKVVQTSGDVQHPWVKDRFGVLPTPDYESDLTLDFDRIYKAVFDRPLSEGVVIGNTGESTGAESTVDDEAKAAQARKKSGLTKKEKEAAEKEAEGKLPDPPPADPIPAGSPTAPQSDAPAPPESQAAATEESPALSEAENTEPGPSASETSEQALTQSEPELEATPGEQAETPPQDSVSPPETETAPAPAADAEPPQDADPRYSMTCTGCGGAIENEDQRDLSWLRFRAPMCRSCFQERKASTAPAKG